MATKGEQDKIHDICQFLIIPNQRHGYTGNPHQIFPPFISATKTAHDITQRRHKRWPRNTFDPVASATMRQIVGLRAVQSCSPFNSILCPCNLCPRKADNDHTNQNGQPGIAPQRKNLSFNFAKKRNEDHATHSALSKQISGHRETFLYSCFSISKKPEAQKQGPYNPTHMTRD
ncbi:hypothetical protein [Acetobacter syzygii]|uniref:hypothetical protein n=1 Tax=Acetobacter syzygii TaxID=146476 RepID=UPI00242F4CCB|nr:hypothetical protein [Acetobacter syzygii]